MQKKVRKRRPLWTGQLVVVNASWYMSSVHVERQGYVSGVTVADIADAHQYRVELPGLVESHISQAPWN